MPGRGFGRGQYASVDADGAGRGRGRGRGSASRADAALDQMLGGGIDSDDNHMMQHPTKVVDVPPKKVKTFKRFQVTRKKQSKFAQPIGYPQAREPMWWTKLSPDLTDPVTLEPIRELSSPPFEIRDDNGVVHYFDALSLANYLISSATFINPVNRRPLTGKICRALDEHLAEHGLSQLKVEQALRLSHMIKAKKGTSTRLKREATTILHSLIDFQSYEDTRGVAGSSAPANTPVNTQTSARDAGWQKRYKRRQRVLHSEGNLAVVDDDEWDSEVVQHGRRQDQQHAQFADILGTEDYDFEFPSLPSAPAPAPAETPTVATKEPEVPASEEEEEEEEEEVSSHDGDGVEATPEPETTVWGKPENVQQKVAADYLKWQKNSVKDKPKRNRGGAHTQKQRRDRQQQQQQEAVRRAQALRKRRQMRKKNELEKLNKKKVVKTARRPSPVAAKRVGPKLLGNSKWMSTPLWGTVCILLAVAVMTYVKINSLLSK